MALLKLKVHAGASASRLLRKAPDAYEIWVRAEAQDGAANAEALARLGRELGIEPKRLFILRGARAPNKLIKVMGK